MREAPCLDTMVGLKSWEVPNGFVVCGDVGAPVLVVYNDDGTVATRALEMGNDPVLFPNGVSSDELVLVHIVEGNNKSLVRRLESNKLTKDSLPVTAQELHNVGLFDTMAETLRKRYIDRLIEIKKINVDEPSGVLELEG